MCIVSGASPRHLSKCSLVFFKLFLTVLLSVSRVHALHGLPSPLFSTIHCVSWFFIGLVLGPMASLVDVTYCSKSSGTLNMKENLGIGIPVAFPPDKESPSDSALRLTFSRLKYVAQA